MRGGGTGWAGNLADKRGRKRTKEQKWGLIKGGIKGLLPSGPDWKGWTKQLKKLVRDKRKPTQIGFQFRLFQTVTLPTVDASPAWTGANIMCQAAVNGGTKDSQGKLIHYYTV
jgi:hypothetical protein